MRIWNRYRSVRSCALRCRSGATAAEFALILPLLIALMFGTLQYGVAMFSYNQMMNAARDAVRAMSVCSPNDPTAIVQQDLPAWVLNANPTITSTTAGGPNGSKMVTVQISVPSSGVTPLSVVYMPPTVSASVTMQEEPLAFGGGACA